MSQEMSESLLRTAIEKDDTQFIASFFERPHTVKMYRQFRSSILEIIDNFIVMNVLVTNQKFLSMKMLFFIFVSS